ncbi:hypothetical protein OF377_00125 [Ureaplasma sp. ES3154-GEN]|uniref:hypothetical protein n=1 Tax=Ureaplasma sp. ES3154-GEN TaxID=2984844 RepID=UPI0021E7B30A|nr:hypothetical protein [Ureaplasma sp. ES3154-GEN]MCV3743294.1 hypothetical protein [Ureaplasma sp. ES3154-GEN]
MILLKKDEKQNIYSGFAALLAAPLVMWNKILLWSTIASIGVQVASGIANIALASIHKEEDYSLENQIADDLVFNQPYQSSQYIYFLGK